MIVTMCSYQPSLTHRGGAEFVSGSYGAIGDIPIVGDWDGDGTDTMGLFRPSTGTFFLRDDWAGGNATITMTGVGLSTDVPIVGDWDGDGVDTVGVYRSSTRRFYLKNGFSSGTVFAITTNTWGNGTELPVVGNWNGTIGSDGTQVTINHSLSGQSLGSSVGGGGVLGDGV